MPLTDVALSRSPAERLTLCCRLFEAGGLTMATGTAFLFPGELKRVLARHWRQCEPAARFEHFFRLHQTKGLPVEYR